MIKENLFLNFLNILLSYGFNVNYFCNIYNRTQNHEILKGKFHKVCARLVYKKLKNKEYKHSNTKSSKHKGRN